MKSLQLALAPLLALAASSAFAHVSLLQPKAEAGSTYQAVLRVGHGCDGQSTTSLGVRLPKGFVSAVPQTKPGWTLATRAGIVTWTATQGMSLPAKEKGEFVLQGKLPRTPGPLWFTVLQGCEQGSLEWSQMPVTGTSTAGLKTPAVLLDVLAPRDFASFKALPQVEGAWARATVPGQRATGAFMRITARENMQLTGVSTPIAGVAEVHEMKMEGDVMRMRAAGPLALTAGQAFDLKPGGYHLMLQDLNVPLVAGTTVALTLHLRNAAGVESRMELNLPVQATGGGAAAPGGHKH